jgi:hypothetical protein
MSKLFAFSASVLLLTSLHAQDTSRSAAITEKKCLKDAVGEAA